MQRVVDAVNRAARAVPVWAVYVASAVPFAWLVWAVASDSLGPDPVKAVENRLGLWALQFLIAGLAVTPLRRIGINLIRHRRALGLIAFFYVVLHFTTWVVLDMALDWGQIVAALWKRPYILIGFAALLAMVPLAVTSTNAAIRRLGPQAWSGLHKLMYGIVAAGALHFLLLVKVITAEPVIYAGVVLGLLGVRLIPKARRMQTA
jgi:sulfoxide reductase heme-binding subunit YedZ